MVSGGDSETGDKVVHDRPDGGVRVPLDVEQTVNGQGGGDGQGQEGHPSESRQGARQYDDSETSSRSHNLLDVLVPVSHRNRRQTLLGLDRPGDIVVGDVKIRRDVRRLEGLYAELGLALLLLRDRDGVGRRLSVHGCESSVGHLDRCIGGNGR